MPSPNCHDPKDRSVTPGRVRWIGLASVALVASALALVACSSATPTANPSTTSPPSRAAESEASRGTTAPIDGVIEVDVASAKHVPGEVDYPQTPPLGGDHAPRWQNCGAYTEPVSTEAGVHALEHGAVWITYQPTLDPADLATIEGLADQSDYILVSPWPDDLPAPIVVSAWGAQLPLNSADDPRLVAFLTAYVQALSAPEPGAPCSGGISAPR